jgi:hypothetical protein
MTDDDILAKYSRENLGKPSEMLAKKPEKPPLKFLANIDRGEEDEIPEDDTYLAYHTSARAKRLLVRRCGFPNRTPSYSNLMDIIFEDENCQEISIVFTYAVVCITGEYLDELAKKLVAERVPFICEFDPKRWEKPEAGRPLITSIKYVSKLDEEIKKLKA